MAKRELKPCGTYAAYARHKANGQEPCEACCQAARDYMRANTAKFRARRREAQGLPPVSRKPCGTLAAYRRHQRHGEKPCDPCREANNSYYRERYNGQARKPPLEPWLKEVADRVIAKMNREET